MYWSHNVLCGSWLGFARINKLIPVATKQYIYLSPHFGGVVFAELLVEQIQFRFRFLLRDCIPYRLRKLPTIPLADLRLAFEGVPPSIVCWRRYVGNFFINFFNTQSTIWVISGRNTIHLILTQSFLTSQFQTFGSLLKKSHQYTTSLFIHHRIFAPAASSKASLN